MEKELNYERIAKIFKYNNSLKYKESDYLGTFILKWRFQDNHYMISLLNEEINQEIDIKIVETDKQLKGLINSLMF